MDTLIGVDLAVGKFVAEGIGGDIAEYWPFTAMGFSSNGELVAGVVYNNYRKRDIQLSAYSMNERWLNKKNLQKIFEYPYNQLNCIRTTAVTGRKNKRTRKLLLGLGYRLEGVCRKGLDGKQDAMIYGMLRDECRWINPESSVSGKI